MTNRSHHARTHYELPPVVSGYAMDGAWSVVVPETVDRTNRVANPSLEINTTGYTVVGTGATIARSTAKQRRGAYSLLMTPGASPGDDGFYYGTVATVSGESLMWSFDIWAPGGVPLRAFWSDTSGVQVGTAVLFYGAGDWRRVQVPWHETSTTTRRLYVRKNLPITSANTGVFYIDGMLVVDAIAEFKYFDGDTPGFVFNQVDFYWNGTPHGSTSTMRAHTRAGGRIVTLASLGFTLTAMLGLGLGTPANIAIPLALGGGEHYQRTLGGARSFDLVGALQAGSGLELDRMNAALSAALDVRRQPVTQPLLLQYEPVNECGDAIGKRVEIKCSLEGGLEGQRVSDYQERLDLRFRIHLPIMGALDGTEGSALDVRDTLSAAENIVRRDRDGIWSDLQTGLSALVRAALWLPDGRLLVGGDFVDAGGVADADFLAVYDPVTDTFAALNATPLSSTVYSLLNLPDGTVAIGGNFLNAGGDANADYLCRLNLTTGAFSAFNATPLNLNVIDMALLPNGDIALAGTFTDAGGDANADKLARMNGLTFAFSAFTTTPLNNAAYAVEVAANNDLYVGGIFTNAGGSAAADYFTYLAAPNYTAFLTPGGPIAAALNPALNGSVRVVRRLSNGNLLVGGEFTSVNLQTDSAYLTLFNGSFYSNAVKNLNAPVFDVAEIVPGTSLITGDFTSINGVALFGNMFLLSGSTVQPLDIAFSNTVVNAYTGVGLSGSIAVGYESIGTAAYTSGTTAVTNSGSEPTKPVIVITHPTTATLTAPLYSIRNLTTHQVISFNLTLLIGETVTLDFARRTFTSNIRGNLAGTVLPGSNFDSFVLVPGPNRLNIFSSLASGSLPDAYAYWTPGYASLADASR